MVIEMNESRLATIEQIREFLAGTRDMGFSIPADEPQGRAFVAKMLHRFRSVCRAKGQRRVLGYCFRSSGTCTLVAYPVKPQDRPRADRRLHFCGHPLHRPEHAMPKTKARASDFGSRLTELRRAAGYTQVQLAAELGIKPLRNGRNPDTQLRRRMQRIEKLDPKAKRQITQILDTFIEREELKQRASAQEASP